MIRSSRSRKQKIQTDGPRPRRDRAARGRGHAEVLSARAAKVQRLEIPREVSETQFEAEGGTVHVTNLRKIFWPELGLTKRDLLQYYLDVSPWLLPHLKDRAMVMKRYPNGIDGRIFLHEARAGSRGPRSIPICSIEHHSGNVIGFPVIQHLASLLWVVNLGCIDLNPWYARCDDVDRPDYLHFDLDPVPDTPFERVLETALLVRDALAELKIQELCEDHGVARDSCVCARSCAGRGRSRCGNSRRRSRRSWRSGIRSIDHRGISRGASARRGTCWWTTTRMPGTARWRRCIRCGRKPAATVSTPVTWEEVERGVRMEDFTMQNVPAAAEKAGRFVEAAAGATRPRAVWSDSYDACRFRERIAPMEAHAGDGVAVGAELALRAEVGRVSLPGFSRWRRAWIWNRNRGKPLTRYFPELVAALAAA